MIKNTRQLIARIGETDQLFLAGNTPELALERSELRLDLVTLSELRQEQIYFLKEAIVLLEQGRIEFEEMSADIYIQLSLNLAKAYMLFFEITKETRYALITQQIMKPMSRAIHGEIYFFLAYASAAKKEPAMTRHWLSKYVTTAEYDAEILQSHPAFDDYRSEDWFQKLQKSKMH